MVCTFKFKSLYCYLIWICYPRNEVKESWISISFHFLADCSAIISKSSIYQCTNTRLYQSGPSLIQDWYLKLHSMVMSVRTCFTVVPVSWGMIEAEKHGYRCNIRMPLKCYHLPHRLRAVWLSKNVAMSWSSVELPLGALLRCAPFPFWKSTFLVLSFHSKIRHLFFSSLKK